MALKILKDVSLKLYSTMRLGGTADFVTIAKSKQDLEMASEWAENKSIPLRVIGQGSNIIWRDEGFKGLLVINQVPGFELLEEDSSSSTYKIGAGEPWDTIVDQVVGLGLQGVECLSLIPGTTGATPVQNVGAYGQEIAETLVSVEAYDRMEKTFVTIGNADCSFGYRTSRFKTVDNGRFLIAYIMLRLHKRPPQAPYYDALQRYLDEHTVSDPTLNDIRKAVIAIRSQKLPNPSKVANNGSYFANPFVTAHHYQTIKSAHKDVKAWQAGPDCYKLSAAWLVEKAGFKGKLDPATGMTSWKGQALVLVNQKARSTQDLLNYEQKIVDAVFDTFNVELIREPELLP